MVCNEYENGEDIVVMEIINDTPNRADDEINIPSSSLYTKSKILCASLAVTLAAVAVAAVILVT